MGKINVFGYLTVGLMIGVVINGAMGEVAWAQVSALLAITCAILSHHK